MVAVNNIATLPEVIRESRRQYRIVRERMINAPEIKATSQDFDAAALGKISEAGIQNPTCLDWIKAALAVSFTCRRCCGTGAFITYVENGVPKGPGGACYRCAGKGHQTYSDVCRNYGYDMHGPPGV